MTSVCVLGLGYIGLPTASLFANNGMHVLGVDTNPSVVETINSGRNHIEEVGLRTLLEAAVSSGHLRASTSPAPADVFIISVPTPFGKEKQPDLSHVFQSARSIIPHLRENNLVILESTVPPGTTLEIAAFIASERPDLAGDNPQSVDTLKVSVAHCPERVLPGSILKELVENDRIVGGVTVEAGRRAAELYGTIASGKIYQTTATTAEIVKLAENTFRDVNISLANEFALICEKAGVNVWEVIRLANNHPRVKILNPGPGVGGHCIAVDPWFFVSTYPEEASLIRAARLRNDAMPELVVRKTLQLVGNDPHPKIACLGASYKGNVGDPRNSPALVIYRSLCDHLAGKDQVALNDLYVNDPNLPLRSLDDVLQGASLILVLTDHTDYRNLDPVDVAGKVRRRVVFDTRNALDRSRWQSAGFEVYMLGMGNFERK